MANSTGLQNSRKARMVVKQALTLRGGRASGSQILSWLAEETGHTPSELNALLAAMEREREIRRWFKDHCLSELALRDFSQVPVVSLDTTPVVSPVVAATQPPQPSSNGDHSQVRAPSGVSGVIDFVRNNGQGSIYVADDVADMAQAMGVNIGTLYNWLMAGRKAGKLKTKRQGGHYFVSLTARAY